MGYEFSGRVRFSEVDENGYLSLPSLVNYFQDVSTFQSEELGIGVAAMKERRQAWMLSSWQIVIDRMPKLCENVTSRTWPYQFKAFFGMRNFTLRGEDGQLCAWANSEWFLFDTENLRPVKVDDDQIRLYNTQAEPPFDMEYAPRKIVLPKGGQVQESFVIGRGHLDTNHHVNNGQYIAMANEYLPEDFDIRQIRVEYRAQALLGDYICPRTIDVDDTTKIISLENQEGKPFAVVEYKKRT